MRRQRAKRRDASRLCRWSYNVESPHILEAKDGFMTTPMDSDATPVAPPPTATSRYPRNRWVQLLRNLLWPTGVGVVTLFVMTITDPNTDTFGTALGKM